MTVTSRLIAVCAGMLPSFLGPARLIHGASGLSAIANQAGHGPEKNLEKS